MNHHSVNITKLGKLGYRFKVFPANYVVQFVQRDETRYGNPMVTTTVAQGSVKRPFNTGRSTARRLQQEAAIAAAWAHYIRTKGE